MLQDFNFYSSSFEGLIGSLRFGLDGFSTCLIVLTAFVMLLCFIASYTINKNIRSFLICLVLIEYFLIASFATLNLFFFYIFFESVLIPMFLMIGL
jgi:NADH:ubiquinone oxidoreductase subunit 4 (subunit M)